MSAEISTHLVVAGILRQDGRILLVLQQGKHDPQATWALPGGVVESGELLDQALVRELREETGLQIRAIGDLAYLAQLENTAECYRSVTFVFEIEEWIGELQPSDPDQAILKASFYDLAEAISRLSELPWAVMRHPLIAYLRNQSAPGSAWLYRAETGIEQLASRIPE